jgi:hypothetical protein
MEECYHLLDALENYVRSPLRYLTFQTGLNWLLISPTEGLRYQVKDHLHILVQLGLAKNPEFLIKVKLSSSIENKCGNKFRVVVYNKKRFVMVVGLAREEQADCPLAATIVRDKNCDEENKKWIELKKSITTAAKITLMQEKALMFLSEAEIRKIAEAMSTTNLFGVGTPVERAITAVTKATSAVTALASA